MILHTLIYIVFAAAYLDAALESFIGCRWHCGWREVVLAFLYASIAGLTFAQVQSA
jgi:hypothetical protein